MWHYSAKKVKDFDGSELYILAECFPALSVTAHTDGNGQGKTICAESRDDLVKWLRTAADDIDKYDVIDGMDEPDNPEYRDNIQYAIDYFKRLRPFTHAININSLISALTHIKEGQSL